MHAHALFLRSSTTPRRLSRLAVRMIRSSSLPVQRAPRYPCRHHYACYSTLFASPSASVQELGSVQRSAQAYLACEDHVCRCAGGDNNLCNYTLREEERETHETAREKMVRTPPVFLKGWRWRCPGRRSLVSGVALPLRHLSIFLHLFCGCCLFFRIFLWGAKNSHAQGLLLTEHEDATPDDPGCVKVCGIR